MSAALEARVHNSAATVVDEWERAVRETHRDGSMRLPARLESALWALARAEHEWERRDEPRDVRDLRREKLMTGNWENY